jgi:hypothetical protein
VAKFYAPDPIQSTYLIPGGNTPANGGQVFFYLAGTSTKTTVYKDVDGNTSWTNPIVLDSGGNLPNGGEVWFTQGETVKVIFAPSTDADPPVSPYWTKDDLSGINDVSAAVSQWIAGTTPTYISAISFSVTGDQTATYSYGRRVQSVNTGGTIYSTVLSSSFGGGITTVTLVNDSGTLDSGLSAVSYGIITLANTSMFDTLAATEVSMLGVNYGLTASVGANALTLALKTSAGVDPSAFDAVTMGFRSSNFTSGVPAIRAITSAAQLTVPAGQSLGTIDNVSHRLWAVLLNDASTTRIGLMNTQNFIAASTTLAGYFPMMDDTLVNASNVSSASLAGVIYATTAVASAAMRVLGYLEVNNTTAGQWASSPSKVQVWQPTMHLPGDIIQILRTSSSNATTGTNTIPADDSPPLNTEGFEVMQRAITPISPINGLRIEAQVHCDHTAANAGINCVLFRTGNASSIATTFQTLSTTGALQLNASQFIQATTGASITTHCRVGSGTAGTVTFNGAGGSRFYGGTYNSYLQVSEIML